MKFLPIFFTIICSFSSVQSSDLLSYTRGVVRSQKPPEVYTFLRACRSHEEILRKLEQADMSEPHDAYKLVAQLYSDSCPVIQDLLACTESSQQYTYLQKAIMQGVQSADAVFKRQYTKQPPAIIDMPILFLERSRRIPLSLLGLVCLAVPVGVMSRVISWMLLHGHLEHTYDDHGNTPLHWYAFFGMRESLTQCISALRSKSGVDQEHKCMTEGHSSSLISWLNPLAYFGTQVEEAGIVSHEIVHSFISHHNEDRKPVLFYVLRHPSLMLASTYAALTPEGSSKKYIDLYKAELFQRLTSSDCSDTYRRACVGRVRMLGEYWIAWVNALINARIQSYLARYTPAQLPCAHLSLMYNEQAHTVLCHATGIFQASSLDAARVEYSGYACLKALGHEPFDPLLYTPEVYARITGVVADLVAIIRSTIDQCFAADAGGFIEDLQEALVYRAQVLKNNEKTLITFLDVMLAQSAMRLCTDQQATVVPYQWQKMLELLDENSDRAILLASSELGRHKTATLALLCRALYGHPACTAYADKLKKHAYSQAHPPQPLMDSVSNTLLEDLKRGMQELEQLLAQDIYTSSRANSVAPVIINPIETKNRGESGSLTTNGPSK